MEDVIECPFCGQHILKENIGVALMESGKVFCHHCGTELEVTLEIREI